MDRIQGEPNLLVEEEVKRREFWGGRVGPRTEGEDLVGFDTQPGVHLFYRAQLRTSRGILLFFRQGDHPFRPRSIAWILMPFRGAL